jgi:hypothetical protein
MKAQKPAEGILKTGEFGLYKSYHIECECGSPECAHKVSIEADDMEVTVNFYFTLRSKWYNMNRWKQIWQILTKGYLDLESTLVMNEQTALNYAETLKTAAKDVKVLRNERFKEKSVGSTSRTE